MNPQIRALQEQLLEKDRVIQGFKNKVKVQETENNKLFKMMNGLYTTLFDGGYRWSFEREVQMELARKLIIETCLRKIGKK